MTTEGSVTLWDAGTLRVTAEAQADGSVLISGQDFGHPLCEEYEYWITVRPADVPALVAALGGASGDDALELLDQQGEEIVRAGEKTWLEDRGVVPEFFNRMGDPRTTSGDRRTSAAAPESWDDLAARVTGVLEELEADEYLVLQADGNRFVQVAFQDLVLRVESVGDQYLDGDSAMLPDQVSALASLGYQPPTHSAVEDDDASDGSPNYWLEVPAERPRGEIVALLVETLQAAHKVESPRHLKYECSSFLGGFIPQPSLGLSVLPNA
jgi:hypothetical protein